MNREMKKDVARQKNETWENSCIEIDRCMGGIKIAEAQRAIKSVRKEANEKMFIPTIRVIFS